jgi:hypothetical protein
MGWVFADLDPLRKLPLRWLDCQGFRHDLEPLTDMPRLTYLKCVYHPAIDAPILRRVKTLKEINGFAAAELLKKTPR